MKEQSEQMSLLKDASYEITRLRRENELLSTRLRMFDDVMKLLHTNVAQRDIGMVESIEGRINRFIESSKANVGGPSNER